MSDPDLQHDEFEIQAAELALGLLDPADRASALRRQIGDPAFAARVGQWRAKGDQWLETITPDAVDPALWERISAGMVAPHANAAEPAPAVFAPDAHPGSDVARSLSRWRAATFAMSAALAATVVLFLSDGQRPPAVNMSSGPRELAASSVAQIADEAGTPLVSAVYSPDAGILTLRVARFDSVERVPELWVIPEGGKPHSLGLVSGGSRLSITLSDEARRFLVDGSTIALTLEPPTGAPHSAPTGAILGTATLSTI